MTRLTRFSGPPAGNPPDMIKMGVQLQFKKE
jgi:hypothetical protein